MTPLYAVDSKNELPSFLEYLYSGLEGYVCAASIDRAKKDAGASPDEYWQQNWFPVGDLQGLGDWIISHADKLDTYVSPATFSSPKLIKDNFYGSNVLWTEFDGRVPDSLGAIPAPTLRVRSSGEGFEHWYWRLETPIHEVNVLESLNRSLTYELQADSSAWDATQILRPPSTFNHKRNAAVNVVHFVEGSVTPSLFEAIPKHETPEYDFAPDSIPDVAEVIFRHEWPQDAIELYRIKEVPQGSRSTALMQLGYFLAEMGLNDGEMFAVLRNADDRWGKFKGRPDRDRRLIDLIAKSRIKYPQATTLDNDTVAIYGFRSLLNTEVHIEWLIPEILQEQGYMLLSGPAGVGKTQWSLRWAMALAVGIPFMGIETGKPRRILFVSCEMGLADIKYFCSLMAQDYTEEQLALLEANLFIMPLGEPFYIDNATGQAKFEGILETVRPDGFFWDSIGSATSGELSSESAVKAIMDFNDRVRQRHSCFSWFIHHNRKATGDNKKPNKQADVYGNQYLVNRATSVYCLWPGNGVIEVIPLKKRLAPLESPWAMTRTPNLNFYKKENIGFTKSFENSVLVDPEPKGPTSEDLGTDEGTGMGFL